MKKPVERTNQAPEREGVEDDHQRGDNVGDDAKGQRRLPRLLQLFALEKVNGVLERAGRDGVAQRREYALGAVLGEQPAVSKKKAA